MEEGLFYATGKRKTAVARVWMRQGAGHITINKRSFEDYCVRGEDRKLVMEPLRLCGKANQFDFKITVKGGGISGQAGAIRHGIGKALIIAEPELRGPLKKEGFLTRDSRIKERKKYGLRSARARSQFSKR